MTAILTRPSDIDLPSPALPTTEPPAESREWAALRRAPIFAGLDDAAVDALLPAFSLARVAAGTVLFHADGEDDQLYVVLDGKVTLSRQHSDGRQSLVAVLGAGDEFGELSVFDPGPCTATARVLTDASVASVTRAELRRWIAAYPEVAVRMLQVLARRLRRTNSVTSDLIFVDVPGRLAKQLLLLARRFGATEGGQLLVTHDLTQSDLAELVGASRETVNKALSNFSQRGWVTLETRSIIIRNPEQLARRAGHTN